jgi:hypothetical protein
MKVFNFYKFFFSLIFVFPLQQNVMGLEIKSFKKLNKYFLHEDTYLIPWINMIFK